MTVKPILIVRIPFPNDGHKEERVISHFKMLGINDWHIIPVFENRSDILFEGIMAEKLPEVKFDELKKILNDL